MYTNFAHAPCTIVLLHNCILKFVFSGFRNVFMWKSDFLRSPRPKQFSNHCQQIIFCAKFPKYPIHLDTEFLYHLQNLIWTHWFDLSQNFLLYSQSMDWFLRSVHTKRNDRFAIFVHLCLENDSSNQRKFLFGVSCCD